MTAEYEQSSFFAGPVSRQRLRKAMDDYVPTLSDDGLVDHFIMTCMQGCDSVGTIASQVAARFPERFESWQQARTHVGRLSTQYSR